MGSNYIVTAGATSNVLAVFIADEFGKGLPGLLYTTTGLTCYYKRNSGTASVSVALAAITIFGTFNSGGFKEIDATNMPGWYEFHPPDAAVASGAKSCVFHFQGNFNRPAILEVTITVQDFQSAGSSPTAAQVATAVWQDTTAGDFTVSGSIGKSLFTSGAVPGAAGGLFIAGTNAATTVTTSFTSTFTGNLTGSVGSVSGAVGSVTGAVGSVTGAVGSVTGNVGGNVTGSVGSVVGNVGGNVVGSVASVTGAVGSVTAAVTLPTIPTAWITADGIATDALGALELGAGAASEIATAVRSELGTELGRIDAAISSRGTGVALDAAGVRSAVGLASANLDTQLALRTGFKLASDGLDLVLVDGKTAPAALQIIASICAGKVSGAGTGTEVFVGLDGSTTRTTVTVDASGNRTAVVYA